MQKLVSSILLLTVVMACGTLRSAAQAIRVDWGKKEVYIDDHLLTKTSTAADIRSIMGRESRHLSEPGNPTRLLIYDRHGIRFVIDTVRAALIKIELSCERGRREFEDSPETLFAGSLSVNGQDIRFTDSIQAIRDKTKLPFESMLAGGYWYTVDQEEFSITITYVSKREEKIRAIYILLDSMDE